MKERLKDVVRDRDELRTKLAAVYSILARRKVPYGDEVEGLVLTAAHVAAGREGHKPEFHQEAGTETSSGN